MKQHQFFTGFAHGFLVLSEDAEFFYKWDDFNHPNDAGCIAWNDTELAVDWPVFGTYYGCASGEGYTLAHGASLILSEKDKNITLFLNIITDIMKRFFSSIV